MTPPQGAPIPADPTQAVILERLETMSKTLDEVRADVKAQPVTYLQRTEWDLWTIARDRELVQLRAEIRTLAAQVENRRPPWWAVLSPIAAALAVLISSIPMIANG